MKNQPVLYVIASFVRKLRALANQLSVFLLRAVENIGHVEFASRLFSRVHEKFYSRMSRSVAIIRSNWASRWNTMSWIRESEPNRFHKFCCRILKAGAIPNHVAIIMDGNRRFAKKHGLKSVLQGHVSGFDTLSKVGTQKTAL